MTNSINCPVCQNLCSVQATSCPKCGHPFSQTAFVNQTIEPQKNRSVIFLSIGIIAGIIGMSLLAWAYISKGNNSQSKIPDNDSQYSITKNSGSASIPSNVIKTAIPTPEPKALINLEAGILYSYDGAQPVSRTEFYLLDVDLTTVLQQAGIKPKNALGSVLSPISRLGFALKYSDQDPEVLPRTMPVIKAHAKYVVTTDFQGKAQFKDVVPKTYYLYGITSTRKAFAIWNMKIDVKEGENSVVLDTNNAALAL